MKKSSFVKVLGAVALLLLPVFAINSRETAARNSPNDWILNPANGHYYEAVEDCGTWHSCQAMAGTENAHLVTIKDSSEQSWLEQTFAGSEIATFEVSIGLTDETSYGNWVWVTGEPVTYTHWRDGEPYPYGGLDYAVIYWGWPDPSDSFWLTSSGDNEDPLDAIFEQGVDFITGRITLANTNPISGVTVMADSSTGNIITTKTDASGYYTLTNLIGGTYILTPTKHNFTFLPPSRQVDVLLSNTTGQDFTGDPANRDIGLRPNPDGYPFSNYGEIRFTDYTINDMRRMFGDSAVCDAVTPVGCIARKATITWNVLVNRAMNGGHCEGMAVTSLRFFKNLDDPADFQANADETIDLLLENARRNFAYYNVFQFATPVLNAHWRAIQKTPSQVLDQLIFAMSGTTDDQTTLVLYHWDSQPKKAGKAHAVTPYAVQYQGNDVWWVFVYDSNYPNDPNRHLVIDTATDTWSYNMGGLGLWSGDASANPNTSHTLGAIALSWWNMQPACPWCISAVPLLPVAESSTGQIWYQGVGHAFITDSQGRRLGYANDQFFSEIPGGTYSIYLGGLDAPQEPIYSLPLTNTYILMLDGQTLTQTGAVSVAQFGPGYAVSVEGATLGPTSQDQLSIAPDGIQVAYHASDSNEATLTIALEESNQSDQFKIRGADIGAGQVVTLTANTQTGKLIFDNQYANGGVYGLEFSRVTGAGEQIFTHDGITISPTDRHYLDYGSWNGISPMIMQIDHGGDGTIDESVPLANQSLQRIYLPLVQRSQ